MLAVTSTTIGRKTGEPRTTVVTLPVIDGDALVIVASYGGDVRNPKRSNLSAILEVKITWDGATLAMTARILRAMNASVRGPGSSPCRRAMASTKPDRP